MKTALRRATHDDLPAIALVDGRAFGAHYSEQDVADFRPLFEPGPFLLACDADDGQIVGVTGDFPFTMTLPDVHAEIAAFGRSPQFGTNF